MVTKVLRGLLAAGALVETSKSHVGLPRAVTAKKPAAAWAAKPAARKAAPAPKAGKKALKPAPKVAKAKARETAASTPHFRCVRAV
jgi:hypothetical protein